VTERARDVVWKRQMARQVALSVQTGTDLPIEAGGNALVLHLPGDEKLVLTGRLADLEDFGDRLVAIIDDHAARIRSKPDVSDEGLVWKEIRSAMVEGRLISDACARVIASWFHDGQGSAGYAFVSTGIIDDPSLLIGELFDVATLKQLEDGDFAVALALGRYVHEVGPRPAKPFWSTLWL
jgi:hypothetical protein